MKETYPQAFNDYATNRLADTLSRVLGKHRLSGEVYVLISLNDGRADRVFTAPFLVQPLEEGHGLTQSDRLDHAGVLYDHIGIGEHLLAVVSEHPDATIIVDKKVATSLRGSQENLNLVEQSDGHFNLEGLANRAIDVFVESETIQRDEADGTSLFLYTD